VPPKRHTRHIAVTSPTAVSIAALRHVPAVTYATVALISLLCSLCVTLLVALHGHMGWPSCLAAKKMIE
jgi:hypothetical protein